MSEKKDLICHRAFAVTAVDLVGLSEQDINDSKGYFKLLDRVDKFRLNPVVIVKRLPEILLDSGSVPLEMDASVKRRRSGRVRGSLNKTIQSRTRQGKENLDKGNVPLEMDADVTRRRSKRVRRSLNNTIQSRTREQEDQPDEEEEDDDDEEGFIACSTIQSFPKTDIRKRRACIVPHPENQKVTDSVQHKFDDVVDQNCRKTSTSQGSLLDKTTCRVQTRLSSKHLEKPWSSMIGENPEVLDGCPRVQYEMKLDRVKTSSELTACDSEFRKMEVENRLPRISREVIDSSGSVELIVDHKANDIVVGIDGEDSSSERSRLEKRSNGIKTRGASAGLESSVHLGKYPTPKIDNRVEELGGSSVVSAGVVAPAQNSPACKTHPEKAKVENVHSSGSVVKHKLEDIVNGIGCKESLSKGFLLDEVSCKIGNGKAPAGLEISEHLGEYPTPKIGEYSVGLDGSISSPSVTAEMVLELARTEQARNSKAVMAKLFTTDAETTALSAYPVDVPHLCPKGFKETSGSNSEDNHPFKINKTELDDSSVKLCLHCGDVLCKYLVCGSLQKIPHHPIKTEIHAQTKYDSKVNLKLTRNTSLPIEDDVIGTEKFIKHEKSNYDFADELTNKPKAEVIKLPLSLDGERETSCHQPRKSAKTPAVLPSDECFARSPNHHHHHKSQMSNTIKRHHQLEDSPYPREAVALTSVSQDPSDYRLSKTMESRSASPKKTTRIKLPQSEKIWTLLKQCVVRLERVSFLDNLVKNNPTNVFGLHMVYKYRRLKQTPAFSSGPTYDKRDEGTEESADSGCDENGSSHLMDTTKKIDLSDGLALKEFCQLKSVVIEDSDSEQEVEEVEMEQTSPLVQRGENSSLPIAKLTGPTEEERLCDSIWSVVLDFGEAESEMEDVSARGKFSNPLPLISLDFIPPMEHSVKSGEAGAISGTPVIGSVTDTLVRGSDQRSLATEDLELDLNMDWEQRIKRFCQEAPCPNQSNTIGSSVLSLLNPESSSPPAESKSPVCSENPPKIPLTASQKRGIPADDDVSYGENSEPVNLRPPKRLKLTDENLSNTIVDHSLNDFESSVEVHDSRTPIKVEKSDKNVQGVDEHSVGKSCNTEAPQIPTNPFHDFSTVPYIVKCNFQNRCRKCRNLNPCANANKKFRLFFKLIVGAGHRLSQPLLDALRNRETPCAIDRTSAHIAASAVLAKPCTILVPATPELTQRLLPPRLMDMIAESVTETNQMESKVRTSIETYALAKALEVKNRIIANKPETPLNQETNIIQPVILHKILLESPSLPYRSNQIIATKSKLDSKIKFVRKCTLPVVRKGCTVALDPSKEAATAEKSGEIVDTPISECHNIRKEVSDSQEQCLTDNEGKDDRSSSDLSKLASVVDTSSTHDTSPHDASVSQGTAEITRAVPETCFLRDRLCASPLKRSVPLAEPDSAHVNDSVEMEPADRTQASSSGNTVSIDLPSEEGGCRIVHSRSTGLTEGNVGTHENHTDSRHCSGEGSSSLALIIPTIDRIPNEVIRDRVLNGPSPKSFVGSDESTMVIQRDGKQPSEGSEDSDLVLTQTETGDLIIPLDITTEESTSDCSLTPPPVIEIPSKVTSVEPLESQIPVTSSSAREDRNPSSLQRGNDETPDVIIIPDKVESIDLTVCEEDNQSTRKTATIDSTAASKTPSIPKGTPISTEPLPDWGVICSSLPELGYVTVQKIGSRLVINDTAIALEPLGFHNIHELNWFLKHQLAELSYSNRNKMDLEWIVATAGYLKMKSLVPTKPQVWKHPSTARETQSAMREYFRKLNISKLEASKRLKAAQTKTDSPVIVSTCSVAKKKATRKAKPRPRKKPVVTPNNQQVSQNGKTVRINGQLVSMGTSPMPYSIALISSNDNTKGISSISLTPSGEIAVSASSSTGSAATLTTSASKGPSNVMDPATKQVETSGIAVESTAKVTKDSSCAVSTSGRTLLASLTPPNEALGSILVPSSLNMVSSVVTVNPASIQSVPVILNGLVANSTSATYDQSASQGSIVVSSQAEKRLTLVGSRTAPVPMLPTIGKTPTSLPPRSSASAKTVLPTSSLSLATTTVSMTINPSRSSQSPSLGKIVVTPGTVNRIVLTRPAAAPNNGLKTSSTVPKSVTNAISTSKKRRTVVVRQNPLATSTATKTSPAASLPVQNRIVQIPRNHQTKTPSWSAPPAARPNHRPILIMRKGANVQTIRTLQNPKLAPIKFQNK